MQSVWTDTLFTMVPPLHSVLNVESACESYSSPFVKNKHTNVHPRTPQCPFRPMVWQRQACGSKTVNMSKAIGIHYSIIQHRELKASGWDWAFTRQAGKEKKKVLHGHEQRGNRQQLVQMREWARGFPVEKRRRGEAFLDGQARTVGDVRARGVGCGLQGRHTRLHADKSSSIWWKPLKKGSWTPSPSMRVTHESQTARWEQ